MRANVAMVFELVMTFSHLPNSVNYHLWFLSQWDKFEPVFGNRDRTKVWLDEIANVRNAIAHGRQLVEYERYLIAGVSGQIRNQVTLYRTSRYPAQAHYAVIERVQDNFGLVGLVESDVERTGRERVRVEVGDRISFECIGSDSRGRDLEWIVKPWAVSDEEAVTAVGNPATLTLEITDGHVSEDLVVYVFVRPLESRHTQFGDSRDRRINGISAQSVAHDDRRRFDYAVNPPPD